MGAMQQAAKGRGGWGAMAALLSAAAVAGAACTSDGKVGDKGLVRFSAVVDFADTTGLDAPVATGSTLLIALQHTQGGELVDPNTYSELVLEVRTQSGEDAEVYPVGVAQYGVYFPGEGTYQLVARKDDTDLDTLNLAAVQPDAIRFSDSVDVSTRVERCSDSESVSLAALSLHRNQTARLAVVPVANGKPLMGMLALSAKISGGASLEAPLLVHGQKAHQLVVSAGEWHGGTVTLTVDEHVHDLHLSQTIPMHSGDATATCD